jgi:HK97 family phage major capsid protein
VATAVGDKLNGRAVVEKAALPFSVRVQGEGPDKEYVILDQRQRPFTVIADGFKTGSEAQAYIDSRLAHLKSGGKQKSLAGFLRAVVANDSATIEKGYGSHHESWSGVEKASMGETSGAVGGYLVPVDYTTAILTKMLDFAIIKPRALVIPMGSAETQCPKVDAETATATAGVPSLFGGLVFTWGFENAPAETEPRFRGQALNAWDLLGYAKVSNQWLEDVGPLADDYLTTILAAAINWQCEFAYFQGLGVPKSQPLGIVSAPATIQVTRGSSGHVTATDLASMIADLLPYSHINAIWCVSPTTLADITKLTGWFLNATGLEPDGRHFTLHGKPGYVTDVILFDPSLYAIGERQQVLVEKSGLGATFPTNQSYFRVGVRVDGKPMVQKSITLQDNSTVVSPYVALL